MRKLLLVDGNAVLHRAYYALPDWRNRSGEATAGVYGFLSMLMRSIEELKPTHLAIVFDTPAPTFRHQMYVGYQSNREKERQVSEDIWGQVEKLKMVFDRAGVPVYTLEGFEADDVIGTLSLQAEEKEEDGQVVIITGDRDLMQLVDTRTSLYMPKRGLSDNQLIDEDRVMEELGVHPEQVVDYKALVGDSSDNYPGVTGIGPKTAVHLLSEFGDFDSLYRAASDAEDVRVSVSVRKKLADGYEGGKLSRDLAKIRRDAPVTWKPEEADVPGMDKWVGVFRELNYASLVSRLTGEKEKKSNQPGLFD